MKFYEEPKLSVVMLNAYDIICTSGSSECGKVGDDTEDESLFGE